MKSDATCGKTRRYQTACEVIARHVCATFMKHVLRWLRYTMIQGSTTQPTIILRDEGGCVLSWRRIVLSADEMYDEHHGNAIRDGLKLVKARSPGVPFPPGFAYHSLSLPLAIRLILSITMYNLYRFYHCHLCS